VNAVAWRLTLGGLTLAGCLYAAFAETEGLRVLTSARQPAVRALQHPLFEVPLRTSEARLVSALPAPGTLRVVEITYERCRTLCSVQGGSLAEVFRALHREVSAHRLHFVSLSVDPGDCPAGIARRVRRLSAGEPGWDGLCVRDDAALAVLTQRMGVVAIRDDARDYRHTPGVFLVAADGRVLAYEPSLNKQTLVLAIQEALQSLGEADGG
jgi:cytochrome oxidase Cu insertion factor (SCO1/SenC/PrrC family)